MLSVLRMSIRELEDQMNMQNWLRYVLLMLLVKMITLAETHTPIGTA